MQKLSEVADLAVVVKNGMVSIHSLRDATISVVIIDRDIESDSPTHVVEFDGGKRFEASLEFVNRFEAEEAVVWPVEADAEWPE